MGGPAQRRDQQLGGMIGAGVHRTVVSGGLSAAVQEESPRNGYPIRERVRGIEGCLATIEQRLKSLRNRVVVPYPEKDGVDPVGADHVLDSLVSCDRLLERIMEHLSIMEDAI